MARPGQQPAPVQTAAVVRRDDNQPVEVVRYRQLQEALDQPTRWAELVTLCGSEREAMLFKTNTLVMFQRSPDTLRKATLLSLIQAVKDAASLGLEPTGLTGEAWILAYGDQAVLIPGWRGYLKRIRNSGVIKGVTTDVYYRNDHFDWGRNTALGFWYEHHPAQTDIDPETGQVLVSRGDYKGAFASVTFTNDFNDGEVMSVPEINRQRDTYSQASRGGRKSPWDTEWGEMARKTVLKRLCKRLPQSANIEPLLALDAIADQLRDALGIGEGNINISKPQRAALAAVARASGRELPEIAAPVAEPEDERKSQGQQLVEAHPDQEPAPPRPPEEPADFDVEDEPELPI
jgi:recombination protein RecT